MPARSVLLFVLILAYAPGAFAGESPRVYFAGHAYMAEAASIPTQFPNLQNTLGGDGSARFDGELGATALRFTPDHFDLVIGDLGVVSKVGPALALALAFERETVSHEVVGGDHKVLIEIAAQVLVMDYSSKQLIASYPLIIQHVDVLAQAPTADDLAPMFAQLVTGAESALQQAFWEVVQTLRLPSAASRTLRLSQIKLGEKARATLSKYGVQESDFNFRVAQQFGSMLFKNQALPILPYGSNQAIGGKMPATFANGDVFQIAIPEADYEVLLTIDGFKKVTAEQTPIVTVFVYGVFATIEIIEPLARKSFFHAQIRRGEPRKVPVSLVKTDDWASFSETLLSLFNQFTAVQGKPSRSWTRDHVVESGSQKVEFAKLQELYESCR